MILTKPSCAKVWRVGYKMENKGVTRAEEKKNAYILEMDPTSKGYRERVMAAAKEYGEQAVNMAKQGSWSCPRIPSSFDFGAK